MPCPSFLRPTNLGPFWLKSLPVGVCFASNVDGLDLRRKDSGADAGSGGAGGAAGGGVCFAFNVDGLDFRRKDGGADAGSGGAGGAAGGGPGSGAEVEAEAEQSLDSA
jgi:hypothetical protein